MAGTYVIPSLRNQSGQDASDSFTAKGDSSSGYEICEILAHFWPTEHEVQHSAAVPQLHRTTLNEAAATRGQLTWVVLYFGANLLWESDRIIFVKSNLDFLPTQSEDESAPQQPIAVFTQTRDKNFNSFDFAGWYQVNRVEICEPHSSELVALLEQKWGCEICRDDRTSTMVSGAELKRSLSRRWASVKLEEDLIASKERGAPKIARLTDRRDSKTVNEMLAEMRDADRRQQENKKEMKTANGV